MHTALTSLTTTSPTNKPFLQRQPNKEPYQTSRLARQVLKAGLLAYFVSGISADQNPNQLHIDCPEISLSCANTNQKVTFYGPWDSKSFFCNHLPSRLNDLFRALNREAMCNNIVEDTNITVALGSNNFNWTLCDAACNAFIDQLRNDVSVHYAPSPPPASPLPMLPPAIPSPAAPSPGPPAAPSPGPPEAQPGPPPPTTPPTAPPTAPPPTTPPTAPPPTAPPPPQTPPLPPQQQQTPLASPMPASPPPPPSSPRSSSPLPSESTKLSNADSNSVEEATLAIVACAACVAGLLLIAYLITICNKHHRGQRSQTPESETPTSTPQNNHGTEHVANTPSRSSSIPVIEVQARISPRSDNATTSSPLTDPEDPNSASKLMPQSRLPRRLSFNRGTQNREFPSEAVLDRLSEWQATMKMHKAKSRTPNNNAMYRI